MMERKTIRVVAAVIEVNGKILCLQRGWNKHAYVAFKYEFPGGKIESGETGEEALIREIREELACEINIGSHLIRVEHDYPDFHIMMDAYHCTSEDFRFDLREHVDAKWLERENLHDLDWAEADIPVVQAIIDYREIQS